MIFWQVGSSATLGTTSRVIGTIIAAHDISLNTGATVSGRVLARGVSADGAVTLLSNSVSRAAVPALRLPVHPRLARPSALPLSMRAAILDPHHHAFQPEHHRRDLLSAPLTDTLPTGVTIAGAPNASTTCSGTGSVTAIAGGRR